MQTVDEVAVTWRARDATASSAWWRPTRGRGPSPPRTRRPPTPRRGSRQPRVGASRAGTGGCPWSTRCTRRRPSRAGALVAAEGTVPSCGGDARRRRRCILAVGLWRRWRPQRAPRCWSARSTSARSRFRTTCRWTTSAHCHSVYSDRFYLCHFSFLLTRTTTGTTTIINSCSRELKWSYHWSYLGLTFRVVFCSGNHGPNFSLHHRQVSD